MNTKVIMEKFRRAISYLMILLLVVTMATGCSQNLTDSQKSNVSSKDREVSQRGPKRIIFSNDGLIYYTGDHYRTFEKLYGEDE